MDIGSLLQMLGGRNPGNSFDAWNRAMQPQQPQVGLPQMNGLGMMGQMGRQAASPPPVPQQPPMPMPPPNPGVPMFNPDGSAVSPVQPRQPVPPVAPGGPMGGRGIYDDPFLRQGITKDQFLKQMEWGRVNPIQRPGWNPGMRSDNR